MPVHYHPLSREFHLCNGFISYVIHILPNGMPANLYCGGRVRDREDFSYLLQNRRRSLAVSQSTEENSYAQQYTCMEYPVFGTGDFRYPACTALQSDGSRVLELRYEKHNVYAGKPALQGLPATYTESDDEADTLELTLLDAQTGLRCVLLYSIFRDHAALARSVRFENAGKEPLVLERAMSLSLDLPDMNYEMITLSGAWSREREPFAAPLTPGVQGVYSLAGASSAEHNPFIMLKRPSTDEDHGEALGFSLVYSGNHMCVTVADTHGKARVLMGIHPDTFRWTLNPGESFQTPEAVMAYSAQGMGEMSRTFHRLYRSRLARGFWRDRERPLVINNWEATGAMFDQPQLLEIAHQAQTVGLELFVLDDGWFGHRDDDRQSLGDWYVPEGSLKLPQGLQGLAVRLKEIGLQFGLWIEPEMVNPDSEIYRQHPEWILCAPGRTPSPSRNQYVLDFARAEVVDYLFLALEKILGGSDIRYVKWDMNRYITECYSHALPPERQGEVYHRYILGVYALYDRLTAAFPRVLFESCASGGARFDPGMLYYAPQAWTSDNTDAMERLKIQYGTSYAYPLSAMSAHVSEAPNQQVGRMSALATRSHVAIFGVFGCEMNIGALTVEEKETLREQIALAKQYRELVRTGDFYRLQNPYCGSSCAWMVVSGDQSRALVGYYRLMVRANEPWLRVTLRGLNANLDYRVNAGEVYGGDLLMNAGLTVEPDQMTSNGADFSSILFELTAVAK